MDDDDLGGLQKPEADDEKSIHSEQQSEKSAISHKSAQSSKSLLSEKSTTSLRSTKSNISEAASMKSMSSQKSGMSEISIKSGTSIKSGISQISGVSGMSQTSLRSGRSEISGISQISGLSKASATSSRISAATNITTASERSLLSEVQHENFYPEEIPEPFQQKKKEKRRKPRKVFESESDCESEKSDVSERSTVSSTAESTAESAISAHSRSSLVSHLSAKSSGTDISDSSKIASRFARGPLDHKASDIEVSMATDITSDHRTSMAMSSAVESDSMVSETETEFEDEDLAEVRAGSAILPNLSICIDRDDEPGYEIVFVKIRDEGSSDSPTKVVRNNMKLARISEEEWNLARGIPCLGLGIDKHSPAELKKQQARAKRFGLDINKNMEEGEVDEDVINRVHEDIIKEYSKRVEELNEGLNLDEMSEGKMIKPSSVTIYGCKELNTEQLLNFFKAYAPDKE